MTMTSTMHPAALRLRVRSPCTDIDGQLRCETTGLVAVLKICVPFIEFARVCRIALFQDINGSGRGSPRSVRRRMPLLNGGCFILFWVGLSWYGRACMNGLARRKADSHSVVFCCVTPNVLFRARASIPSSASKGVSPVVQLSLSRSHRFAQMSDFQQSNSHWIHQCDKERTHVSTQ